MSFWPHSLFGRLALSLSVFITVAMLALGYVLLSDAQRRHELEQQKRVQASARVLAEASQDALAARDYELLDRWVKSVMSTSDMAYAYLDRADGTILVHTDIDQVARRGIGLGELRDPLTRTVTYGGTTVFEAVHPVWLGARHLANAHVAYYPGQLDFFATSDFTKMALILLLSLAGIVLVTLLIVRQHMRPISELTDHVTGLSLEALRLRLDPAILRRQDEVGALARAFDTMAHRLIGLFAELRREEQRLQETVEARTRALASSNRELEAFCHSVSHDLRAPLRSLDGFSEALLEDYGDRLDEQARDYLQRIRKGTERMRQLIEDLLRLSRISRHELHLAEVDLVPLAKEIVDDLRAGDPQRDVRLVLPETLPVRGDSRLLRIMLENLFSNAWKYTRPRQPAEIALGVSEEGGETVYWVRDNGVGFDMAYADKLFGVFQRLHHQDEFPGTGVGLATVARIVERHGGRVWADAEMGMGAIFFFTLGDANAANEPADGTPAERMMSA